MERCWKQDPEERHPGFGPVVQKLSILWSRFGDPRVKNTPRVSFNPPSVLRISEHKTDIGEKVRSIQSANCGGSAATGVTTSSSQLTGRPGVKITPCISGGKTISASASREVASVPDEILSSHLTAMAIDVSAETHSAERGKPHESRETIRIPAPSNIKPPLQTQRAKRLQHTGSKVRRPKRENKVGKGKRDVSRETVSIPGSPDIDLLLHKQRVKSIEQNPSAVGRQPLTKKNRDLKNDLLHTRWQQLQMEVGKAKPQSSGDLSKISKLPDIESIGEKERIRRLLIQGKLAMATRDVSCLWRRRKVSDREGLVVDVCEKYRAKIAERFSGKVAYTTNSYRVSHKLILPTSFLVGHTAIASCTMDGADRSQSRRVGMTYLAEE